MTTTYRWVTYAAVVCAFALIARVGLSVRKANHSDNGTVPEPDPYAEPVPMTWTAPNAHTITYRFTTGPAGVESSLN